MADRPDERKRKAALAAWKARQRSAARDEFPLPAERLHALFEALNRELPVAGCDRTLKLVRAWCDRNEIAFPPVEAWLPNNGGSCDCGALANAEQAFEEACREPDSQPPSSADEMM